MKNILCYGDSNTYGYNPAEGHGSRYSKNKRWTTILQQLLGNEYEVIAEGLNGRTTAYDRPGFSWKNGLTHLPAIMGSHKPIDYIIFMLGTNDCNTEMKLSSIDIAHGMELLIRATIEYSKIQQMFVPEIILIAPAPISGNIEASPFYGEIDITSCNKSVEIIEQYKSIADKYSCNFIDASDVEVSKIDCEHLTENGHKMLAEMIYSTVFDK